tara:strand:+ start:2341 stop:2898 length:558 start_codon:yes stop_codon:yes gene_type:complete
MSAVKLIPASGGGSVSLAPPNSTSGADVTITMPTASQGLGKILQVLQAQKTDTASTAHHTSFIDISGLSQAITPSSTSSKILVTCNILVSNNDVSTYFNLVRGSTTIAQPANTSGLGPSSTLSAISTHHMVKESLEWLDSPNTTSATTYKIQWKSASNGTTYINRWYGTDNYHTVSTLTLMEVAV